MNKKKKINVVYSTNPDFDFDYNENEEQDLLPVNEQLLYVSIDRKKRAGKEVTLIEGFVGPDEDRKSLAKLLKNKCGVGGSVKDFDILIQGNLKDKVSEILSKEGYRVKKKGGN